MHKVILRYLLLTKPFDLNPHNNLHQMIILSVFFLPRFNKIIIFQAFRMADPELDSDFRILCPLHLPGHIQRPCYLKNPIHLSNAY